MGKTIVVSKPIVAADFTTIDTGTLATQAILDTAAIVLTEAEVKSLIGVSIVRSGEMMEVKERIVEKHPAVLSAGMTLANYEADFSYLVSLNKSHSGLLDQAAKMGVLIIVAENNLYVKTSAIMDNTNNLGKTDKVLGDLAKEISVKYHPHTSTQNSATNFKIGPGVVIKQGGVVTEKYFTNKSKAVISVNILGGNINTALLVNPFEGILIPKTWHNLEITNLSANESGSYDIFLK